MKIKCRIGWHDWSKWEDKGEATFVVRPNPYLVDFCNYEVSRTELVRTCNYCGWVQKNILDDGVADKN